MMTGPLLPLLPALGIAGAAATVLWRHPVWQRLWMVLVPGLVALAAVDLLLQHRAVPVIAENVGSFAPGVAIAFASDSFSALMLLVTSVTSLVVLVFMMLTGEDRYRLVPPLTLMLLAGVYGALLTADLFNLFVFVEVMLLPSYALIAVTGTWRRLGMGRTFVVINLLTSTILLVGVGLVYATAGSVNLAMLTGVAAQDPRSTVSSAVVLLALAVKGAVVPVHTWLPRAYPATSAAVMGLFAGLHTKVALYALFRVTATLYEGPPPWHTILLVVAGLTILVGSYATFGEHVVRRALAWQMVAGVGHIVVGLVVFTAAGLAAGIFYTVHHIVTMGALILLAGAVEQTYGSGRYERLSGLIRRDTVLAVGFALALMSLVGLPPSSGFFGKVGLVAAAARADDPVVRVGVVALVVVGAVASLVAMQKLWTGVFFGPDMATYRPDSPQTGRAATAPLPEGVRIPGRLMTPGLVLVGLQLAIFVLAGPLSQITHRAAQGLLDLDPYIQAVLG